MLFVAGLSNLSRNLREFTLLLLELLPSSYSEKSSCPRDSQVHLMQASSRKRSAWVEIFSRSAANYLSRRQEPLRGASLLLPLLQTPIDRCFRQIKRQPALEGVAVLAVLRSRKIAAIVYVISVSGLIDTGNLAGLPSSPKLMQHLTSRHTFLNFSGLA